MFELFNRSKWRYKRNVEFYHTRDLAYSCLLYLSSARCSEILKVTRELIVEGQDSDFLILNGLEVSKRKRKFRDPEITKQFKYEAEGLTLQERKELLAEFQAKYPWVQKPVQVELPLPRVGDLAPFTSAVEQYLPLVPKGRLFKFGRGRGWQIINFITSTPDSVERHALDPAKFKLDGIFPHFIRGESLSFQINLLRSSLMVSKDRGIVSSGTIEHYFTSQWRDHQAEYRRSIEPVKQPYSPTKTLGKLPQKPVVEPVILPKASSEKEFEASKYPPMPEDLEYDDIETFIKEETNRITNLENYIVRKKANDFSKVDLKKWKTLVKYKERMEGNLPYLEMYRGNLAKYKFWEQNEFEEK